MITRRSSPRRLVAPKRSKGGRPWHRPAESMRQSPDRRGQILFNKVHKTNALLPLSRHNLAAAQPPRQRRENDSLYNDYNNYNAFNLFSFPMAPVRQNLGDAGSSRPLPSTLDCGLRVAPNMNPNVRLFSLILAYSRLIGGKYLRKAALRIPLTRHLPLLTQLVLYTCKDSP